MNEKKKGMFLQIFWTVLLSWLTCYLLLHSRSAGNAALSGLRMAFFSVVPSVFPYFVISGVFVSSGLSDRMGEKMRPMTALFGLPGCCAGAVFLGLLCGFPMGAHMTGALVKRGCIDREQGARLSAFTNFCGPSYLIGVLGGQIFSDVRIGFVIFGVQSLLALTAGICLGRGKRATEGVFFSQSRCDFSLAFTESVKSACRSTLHICAYITFFSVFMSSLSPFMNRMSETAKALFYGFFEMSGAVAGLKDKEDILFCAVLIVFWSGVSVLMQVISALSWEGEKISVIPYLAVRVVCMPLCAGLTYIICVFLHFT